MGAHHSLRLPLSLHLQGADVSGISDVQNPPQPSHPRKSLEPAETMPRPDEPAKRACCKFMDSVEAICKKRLSSAWGGHKLKDDESERIALRLRQDLGLLHHPILVLLVPSERTLDFLVLVSSGSQSG